MSFLLKWEMMSRVFCLGMSEVDMPGLVAIVATPKWSDLCELPLELYQF